MVGLRLMELRCRGQVWHNRNGIDEIGDGNSDDDRGRLRRDIGVVANAVVALLVGAPFLLTKVFAFEILLRLKFLIEVGRLDLAVSIFREFWRDILNVKLLFGALPEGNVVVLKASVAHPRRRRSSSNQE